MNPKLIAASLSALLVAAGLFVYLGTGLEPAETIEPSAAEAGFAGQERREVEPWMPAPGMGTLADASIDALHEISVGASPSEALQKASSSRSLALNGQLDEMFGPEAVENCEMKYWFMTDSFVNACSPYESFFGDLAPTWQWVISGDVFGIGTNGNTPLILDGGVASSFTRRQPRRSSVRSLSGPMWISPRARFMESPGWGSAGLSTKGPLPVQMANGGCRVRSAPKKWYGSA